MDNSTESGLTYLLNSYDILIEPFYHYSRLDDGNHHRGYRQRYHLAGLRIKSRNMKTGYIDHGIDFNESGSIKWLNRFGWMISAGRTVREKNHEFNWDSSIKVRWDIMLYKMNVPYMAFQTRLLRGEERSWEFCPEIGIRLNHDPAIIFFNKYSYRAHKDMVNGMDHHQFLIGLRFEI